MAAFVCCPALANSSSVSGGVDVAFARCEDYGVAGFEDLAYRGASLELVSAPGKRPRTGPDSAPVHFYYSVACHEPA